MASVRVRFAPSPTGFFHIGSARTALFNWLYARRHGGSFILRIEDTDKERNTREALEVLLSGMAWLGLEWDEGPGVGGDRGPYFQSERSQVYLEHLESLRSAGRVYDRDGAVFFRISGQPQIIEDAVRGRVERTEEKDFVIIRSNGSPVFHFVNVVDDLTMGITHVIRGEDHLSNTSKHTELIKAFGADLPVYAHIPLILKQHGSGKMSKRDEGALIEDYQKLGYLPDAVVNNLVLLGWSPKDDREKMSRSELIERFDLEGVNKSNARFDDRKMNHLNGLYIRDLSESDFADRGEQVLADAGTAAGFDSSYVRSVLRVCQEKIRVFSELPDYTRYFFSDDYPTDEKAMQKVLRKGEPIARLKELEALLRIQDDFSPAGLEEAIDRLVESGGHGRNDYFGVARIALSGVAGGPGFYDLLHLLGKDRCLERISRFLNTVGS
ncbi:MAG: glutamate--tRNA ligase family protein [Opitutaceae bacterium]